MKIQMASSGAPSGGSVQARTGGAPQGRIGSGDRAGTRGTQRGQRGVRGGRGAGRGGIREKKKEVTAEELDAELDTYISKV